MNTSNLCTLPNTSRLYLRLEARQKLVRKKNTNAAKVVHRYIGNVKEENNESKREGCFILISKI